MDLIENGIKTDVANWLIKSSENQINYYELNGINYLKLIKAGSFKSFESIAYANFMWLDIE